VLDKKDPEKKEPERLPTTSMADVKGRFNVIIYLFSKFSEMKLRLFKKATLQTPHGNLRARCVTAHVIF